MGVYLLKISPKPFGTLNGEPVYRASFAYKPYSNDDAANKKMARASGARTAELAWERKSEEEKTGVLIARHDGVYRLRYCVGVIYDGAVDTDTVGMTKDVVRNPRKSGGCENDPAGVS